MPNRDRWKTTLWVAFIGGAMSCIMVVPAAMGETPPVDWLSEEDLESKLNAFIGLQWRDNPLRSAVSNLARSQRIAIFIDRRVDPDQKIDFASPAVRFSQLLDQLTGQCNLAWCQVGPVIYIGPEETAQVLATVAALRHDEVENLPRNIRASLLRATPCHWEHLSEPHSILAQLLSEYELQLLEGETIPHDLWPEISLPDMPFSHQLSILLAGFGMTFELAPDGSSIRPVPLPETATLERRYPGRNQTERLVSRLQSLFPELEIAEENGEILVTGRWEAHQRVKQALAGRSVPVAPTEGETRYTLRVDNQRVGYLLQSLAAQMELEISFEDSAMEKLDRRVSFSIIDATFDELLEAATEGAGLRYRKEGETLTLSADDEE